MPGYTATPPSRSTSARSIGPLASTIFAPSGFDPAGRSSSPVTTILTRGRRTTAHLGDADRREHAEVLRTQHAAGAQGDFARRDVLAAASDVFFGRDVALGKDAAGLDFDEFDRQHGVGPVGQRRAGHDPHRLPRPHAARKRPARHRLADHLQRQSVVGRRAQRVGRAQGEAVHHRPGEAGDVDVALHVSREHPGEGLFERHRLFAQRRALPIDPVQRLGHGGPPREAAHAHVVVGGRGLTHGNDYSRVAERNRHGQTEPRQTKPRP